MPLLRRDRSASIAHRGRTQPPSPVASSLSLSVRSESQPASRLRSLLSRWVTQSAVSAARLEEREADLGRPSRQFLHGASAIQAAVWIVARLADGLDHAHSRGLLHRDLKPANILLAGDGTPMLLDFNLSVEALPHSGETEIHRAFVGGTLPYMAPEHLDAFNPRGSTPPEAVDERSDIYALGLILFEILAGEPAFPEVPSAIRCLTRSSSCSPAAARFPLSGPDVLKFPGASTHSSRNAWRSTRLAGTPAPAISPRTCTGSSRTCR